VRPVSQVRAELLAQPPGDTHHPTSCWGLGESGMESAADFGELLDHMHLPAEQIQPADLEAGQLAPTQPRVGGEPDQGSVRRPDRLC